MHARDTSNYTRLTSGCRHGKMTWNGPIFRSLYTPLKHLLVRGLVMVCTSWWLNLLPVHISTPVSSKGIGSAVSCEPTRVQFQRVSENVIGAGIEAGDFRVLQDLPKGNTRSLTFQIRRQLNRRYRPGNWPYAGQPAGGVPYAKMRLYGTSALVPSWRAGLRQKRTARRQFAAHAGRMR